MPFGPRLQLEDSGTRPGLELSQLLVFREHPASGILSIATVGSVIYNVSRGNIEANRA